MHMKKTRILDLDLKWRTVRKTKNSNQTLFVAHCIVDKIGGDPTCGLFCVFDGHGGKQVSDYCEERFPVEFSKEL